MIFRLRALLIQKSVKHKRERLSENLGLRALLIQKSVKLSEFFSSYKKV